MKRFFTLCVQSALPLSLLLLVSLIVGPWNPQTQAQVTTNASSGLNPTYPDLSSAITALNGAKFTAPVVITLNPANPQTSPAGGYAITATGTVANTILITGNSNTIPELSTIQVGSVRTNWTRKQPQGTLPDLLRRPAPTPSSFSSIPTPS